MKRIRVLTVASVLAALSPLCAQDSTNAGAADKKPQVSVAQVAIAGSSGPVIVTNLKIKFTFVGIGFYNPSEYSETDMIPLDTGITVDLARIQEVTFIPREVKHDNRTERAVEVEIQLDTGATTKQRMKPPSSADVYLVGKTEFGGFKYCLNERGKSQTVKVTFQRQTSPVAQ